MDDYIPKTHSSHSALPTYTHKTNNHEHILPKSKSSKQASKSVYQHQKNLFAAESKRELIQHYMDSSKVGNAAEQCHQCGNRNESVRDFGCKNCKSNKYCVQCLMKWYPSLSEEELVEACPICCNDCNCKSCLHRISPKEIIQKSVTGLSRVIDLTKYDVDLQFLHEPEILKGVDDDDKNITGSTNGWLCEEPAATEVSGTPMTTVGLWRGQHVGPSTKKLLESVENQYPNTFQGVHFRFQEMWPPVLKQFRVVIKAFLGTPVESLDQGQVTSLCEDLKELERFGFDLSWAHQRLNMVEKLKFGNEPLSQELAALDESLQLLKERIDERRKAFMEAHEMLMEAQLEYNSITHARNKKSQEMMQKFGNEYDQVLKGHLGSGMLPRY